MQIPNFTYHEQPISTGVIESSSATCSCCGQKRGFVYSGPVRITNQQVTEPEELCPWCIADGSAAKKYQLVFVRPGFLASNNLQGDIVSTVTCRTPGYSSWQEPVWLCHCEDACVFCGDLTEEEAQQPDWMAVAEFLGEPLEQAKTSWLSIASLYKQADPSIFKFRCRHCGKVFYQLDSP